MNETGPFIQESTLVHHDDEWISEQIQEINETSTAPCTTIESNTESVANNVESEKINTESNDSIASPCITTDSIAESVTNNVESMESNTNSFDSIVDTKVSTSETLTEAIVQPTENTFSPLLTCGIGILAGAAAILLLLRILRLRSVREAHADYACTTVQPIPSTIEIPHTSSVTTQGIELINLQGIGKRAEQQDAFAISPLENYSQNGILGILCDGMGGMIDGESIASEVVTSLRTSFPWESDHQVLNLISEISARIFRLYRGQGGATLVMVHIQDGLLRFWCVGDSDLFLLRDGCLYALNRRHEYQNELLLRALHGAMYIEDAFSNPQAGALQEFIGRESVHPDFTRTPFQLEENDLLLLCSDGVSDTLTTNQIREIMLLPMDKIADKLEESILAEAKKNQDNYTAILFRYHKRK